MGQVASWVCEYIYPEEQLLWQAAGSGDVSCLQQAIAKLTPSTRHRLEWQEPCSGRTALAAAAAHGCSQCVLLLVEAGANCNVKDTRGNTPLHLACKRGHVNVVQYLLQVPNVFPHEINRSARTPLDVVRHQISKCESQHRGLELCVEALEHRFCLYSGWLYEKTDNVLSMVSGISSLNSWSRRWCVVLQRGAPDVLELAMFAMRPGQLRPVCPSSVVIFLVAGGLTKTSDGKWFNRKEYTFSIKGSLKDRCHHHTSLAVEELEFAAVDELGFQTWQNFFSYHQDQFLSAAASYSGNRPAWQAAQTPAPPTETAAAPTKSVPVYQPEPRINESKPSSTIQRTTAAQSSDDEIDEDLRRAIELSLLTAPTESGLSPPLPVSAPDWEDDEEKRSPGELVSSSDTETNHTSEGGTTHSSPVVNYGPAPAYSSIGECVICFDGPQAAVCVPCGHNAICMTCAEEILATTCECPVCRVPIRELIKLYRV